MASMRASSTRRAAPPTADVMSRSCMMSGLSRSYARPDAVQVDRLYTSVTVGCPAAAQGRVETNIVRDPSDRKRMAGGAAGQPPDGEESNGFRRGVNTSGRRVLREAAETVPARLGRARRKLRMCQLALGVRDMGRKCVPAAPLLAQLPCMFAPEA